MSRLTGCLGLLVWMFCTVLIKAERGGDSLQGQEGIRKPSEKQDGPNRVAKDVALKCFTKKDKDNNCVKLFVYKEERWPCKTVNGLNNCLQVPMLLGEQEYCIKRCCKEETQEKKSSPSTSPSPSPSEKHTTPEKKTPEGKRKTAGKGKSGANIGLFIGIIAVVITMIIIGLGIVFYRRRLQRRTPQVTGEEPSTLLNPTQATTAHNVHYCMPE